MALRVVCYLNQFFGQLGGEEKAGVGPQVADGAVGIQDRRGRLGVVDGTCIFGAGAAGLLD